MEVAVAVRHRGWNESTPLCAKGGRFSLAGVGHTELGLGRKSVRRALLATVGPMFEVYSRPGWLRISASALDGKYNVRGANLLSGTSGPLFRCASWGTTAPPGVPKRHAAHGRHKAESLEKASEDMPSRLRFRRDLALSGRMMVGKPRSRARSSARLLQAPKLAATP